MREYNSMTCWPRVTVAAITLLLVGCGSDPQQPVEPVAGLQLEARSDTLLTGAVGSRIDSVPMVRLTLNGNPAPGREIRFSVSAGGSIETSSQRTDTAGMASPGAWTLGTLARPQTLTARADGVADVVFRAVAVAGPAASMNIVAGDKQVGAVGAPLPIPLQVKVADTYGNPVPDRLVTFAVAVGHGTIDSASVMTDSSGLATSGTWTLGDAGVQLVGIATTGKPVLYFEAFACGDPCRGQEFLFTRGDTNELYRSAGAVSTPLFTGATTAAWSPDGQQIAIGYYDGYDEVGYLYVMNADGSHVTPGANELYEPSWSPDGLNLAARGPEGVYKLAQLDGVWSATALLAAGGWEPAWSPDGTRIAFVQRGDQPALKVMNSDGSGVTFLATGGGLYGSPTWSPDGLRVAFTHCVDACRLYTVGADGTGAQPLTAGEAWRPAWSPDGSRIAFVSGSDVVWVPADGGVTMPIPLVQNAKSIAWRP